MSQHTYEVSPPRLYSTGSAWIQPAQAIEATKVSCSAIENLCARVHASPTFFFQLGENERPTEIYAHLCRGLARLSNQNVYLAGVLRQDERGAFRIEVSPSPQAGTRFYYADLSQDHTFPSFQDLQNAGYPFADGSMDGLDRLCPDPFPQATDGCPSICPQLTHVRGGLVLTVSMTHQLGDLMFLRETCAGWARETKEAASAVAEGRLERPIPMPYAKEVMDRTRMTPHNPGPLSVGELSTQSKALPDWILVDPTNPVSLEAIKSIIPPAYIPTHHAHAEDDLRVSVSGVWRFSLASLKGLQRSAQEATRTGATISTIDVLTAYIWERVFAAKYFSSTTDRTALHVPAYSEIVYAGDLRRRLDPPLPAGYVPGCVDLFRCSAKLSTLTARYDGSQGMSNLADMAASIRESNANWSEEQYMTLLSLSQRTPISPGFVPRGPMDLLVTDHSRAASVVTADWGPQLGACAAYREPYLGRDPPSGEVTILPRCPNGDLEVMISAERIVLDRLEADVDLSARAEKLFVLHDVVAEKTRRAIKARL
ncbi:hypothetical protein Q7P37_008873 [Cladosporium fusiforme]